MKYRALGFGLLGILPLVAAACGSSKGSATTTAHASSSSGGFATSTSSGSSGSGTGGSGGSGSSNGGNIGLGGSVSTGPIVALSISPGTATLDVTSGSTATQSFQAIAQYQNHSTGPAQGVTWTATNLAVGSIDGMGNFTANGTQGGTVQITATLSGLSATATLTVTNHAVDNPSGIDTATQGILEAATTPDPTYTLAYPYDSMTYPRGINGPPLMWTTAAPDGGTVGDAGAPSSDVIYVHLVSNGFELKSFQTNLADRYDFDPTMWSAFAQSSTGDAHLTVARLVAGGTSATILADQHWTIAPGAMRGTIYYWAINIARVVRIQPGAAAPDDFLGASTTCPSCHTVAANGSRLVMNEGNWPDMTTFAYNLGTSTNDFSGLYSGGNGASQWALAGVSPDGSTIVQNFTPLRGNIGQQTGAFDAVTGAQLPTTGLEGNPLGMPAFSADGKLLVYVNTTTGDLRAYDWDPVAKVAANDRLLVAAGTNPATKIINAPTVSPDHQWVIYQRSSGNGSEGINADLYMASVAQPGTEVALDNLNGASYPFAAGARDHDLNYEPTFAPVAAGGYFWVVFHSRRTFGNALTGAPFVQEGVGVKQLWVAAIDQAPTAGKDASHAGFWLPGQDVTTLNMRGYWSLPPCMADGNTCATGTDCCGGYCDSSGDSGSPVCKSSSSNGCSSDGDHCNTAADCCNAADTCINNVCSQPPPQ